MKYYFSLSLICCSLSLFSQNLYIEGGWVFTGHSDRVEKNEGIHIRNGKIFSLKKVNSNWSYDTLQLGDQDYILPGMIDLHAHYRVQFEDQVYDDTLAQPLIFLANGVTSTFPAGEIEPEKMLRFRKNITAGRSVGPRILSSGPYYGRSAPDWDNRMTVEDIYARVDKWAALGAKGFKAKGIMPHHLKALIERAHQHGLTVTAHLDSGYRNSVNPEEAIQMGIDRVEHFLGGELLIDNTSAYNSIVKMNPDDPLLNKIIQLYIDHQVYFDATITTYGAIGKVDEEVFEFWTDEKRFLTPYARKLLEDPPLTDFGRMCAQIYEVKKKVIKRFYDAGGLISLGTDRPFLERNFLGFQLGGFCSHREMQILSEAGIPNHEVLKIATLNSARAIRMSDQLGSIAVGKLADLFIIKGNPLVDIRNTRSVHTVIKAGKVYESDRLFKLAEGKLGPVGE